MRSSEFRGKGLYKKKWLYGGLIVDGKGNAAIANLVILNNCNTAEVDLVDPDSVGEYTGMKDRNQRKVFEHDILKDGMGSIGIIIHTDGMFAVDFGEGIELQELTETLEVCEVIGNIHDNPDLIP